MTHSLDRRLSCLERQLRFHRRLTLGLLAAAGALILVAAGGQAEAEHEVLRTHGLEVINRKGRVVCRLGYASQGGQLEILDASGRSAVQALTTATGGQLSLCGSSGRPTSRFSSNPYGGQFSLLNLTGKMVMAAGATVHSAEIGVFSDEGHQICTVGEDRRGNGAMQVRQVRGGDVKMLGFQP